MASEKFCLRWNDFESNISVAFRELRQDKDFFDVTLSCDDEQQLLAHKVILSACSPFFKNILRRNLHQHPLLYLKGVKYTDLQSVLNFMYHGEVNVAQEELNSFLAVAEDLKVKGLTQSQPASNTNSGGGSGKHSSSAPPRSPLAGSSSHKVSRAPDLSGAMGEGGGSQPPPSKRPRPSAPLSTSAYGQNRTDRCGNASGGEDDDDIQEVVPVKSEPRETAAASAATIITPATGAASSGAAMDDTYSNALVTEEGEAYDESYEDYGQYEQSFGGGEGGGDSALVDLGPDGSKDCDSRLDSLTRENCSKGPGPKYYCQLCGKSRGDITAMRLHMEACHFPSARGYECRLCLRFCKTRHALQCHMSRYHKDRPVDFSTVEAQ